MAINIKDIEITTLDQRIEEMKRDSKLYMEYAEKYQIEANRLNKLIVIIESSLAQINGDGEVVKGENKGKTFSDYIKVDKVEDKRKTFSDYILSYLNIGRPYRTWELMDKYKEETGVEFKQKDFSSRLSQLKKRFSISNYIYDGMPQSQKNWWVYDKWVTNGNLQEIYKNVLDILIEEENNKANLDLKKAS